MSWQKCPICNGDGQRQGEFTSATSYNPCPTCNGARIINELTGLPPKTEIKITDEELTAKLIELAKKQNGYIPDEQKEAEIKDIMDRTEALTRNTKREPPRKS